MDLSDDVPSGVAPPNAMQFPARIPLRVVVGGIRQRAKKNSLSDSHDCEKLPSRGAVESNCCCREIVWERGKERFNRIVKSCPDVCG
jgi:hypothetical protein